MLERYKKALIDLYLSGESDPNVDLFLQEENNSKPSFPSCLNCDIIGCVGDEELNLKLTGESTIPPYSFCLCRDIEKQVADEIRRNKHDNI